MSAKPVKAVRKSGPERSPCRQAAEAAGMSPHQMRRSIRVASIPSSQFEKLIESDDPPGVSELARLAQGKPEPRQARRLLYCPHCSANLSIQPETIEP
jgi:hypothetical protein